MIGGSTDLQKGPGYYSGDLSGISAKRVPFWFSPFINQEKKIARTETGTRNWKKWWSRRLTGILDLSWAYLRGYKCAWRKVLRNIISVTFMKSGPTSDFFVHGGVSFEPYKKGFEKLLGSRSLISRLISHQRDLLHTRISRRWKEWNWSPIFIFFLNLSRSIVENFDQDGNVCRESWSIDDSWSRRRKRVMRLMISTSAGAVAATWSGDTVRFTDKERCEIIIKRSHKTLSQSCWWTFERRQYE